MLVCEARSSPKNKGETRADGGHLSREPDNDAAAERAKKKRKKAGGNEDVKRVWVMKNEDEKGRVENNIIGRGQARSVRQVGFLGRKGAVN